MFAGPSEPFGPINTRTSWKKFPKLRQIFPKRRAAPIVPGTIRPDGLKISPSPKQLSPKKTHSSSTIAALPIPSRQTPIFQTFIHRNPISEYTLTSHWHALLFHEYRKISYTVRSAGKPKMRTVSRTTKPWRKLFPILRNKNKIKIPFFTRLLRDFCFSYIGSVDFINQLRSINYRLHE